MSKMVLIPQICFYGFNTSFSWESHIHEGSLNKVFTKGLRFGSYQHFILFSADQNWIRVVRRLNQVGLIRRFLRESNENKSTFNNWKSDGSHVIKPAKLSFDLMFEKKFMMEAWKVRIMEILYWHTMNVKKKGSFKVGWD